METKYGQHAKDSIDWECDVSELTCSICIGYPQPINIFFRNIKGCWVNRMNHQEIGLVKRITSIVQSKNIKLNHNL